MNKQRLELDWIGKDDEHVLEPRIMIQNSFVGEASDQNLLINGDNLLALKALESEYTNKIQCIYIDPPFNTKQTFENYDDGMEHSLWLTMMRQRLLRLHRLLHNTGTLFVHIDDNELAYLTVMLDEIFGRKNRVSIVTFKQSSVSGPKSINPGLVTTSNYILIYCKNKDLWKSKKLFAARNRDDRYSKIIENEEAHFSKWKLISLKENALTDLDITPEKFKRLSEKKKEALLHDYVIANASRVVRTARVQPHDVNEDARCALRESIGKNNVVFKVERVNRDPIFFLNGEQLLFYSSKVKNVNGTLCTAEALSTIWDDILSNNLHKEGGVRFPNGKKPEFLLKRCIEMSTDEGDYVLDSFAGSGTTPAVAHKLNRKWIAIELGEHARTHCVPRLTAVVSGTDESGITNAVNWKGGGGFKFMTLAPSLLEKDDRGQWVISKKYNATMLTAAVCKHEGFKFRPDQKIYWKQGYSTEKDFIFVTTQFLTAEHLQRIHDQLKEDETLLISAKAFRVPVNKFERITLKKIPQSLLTRGIEFGREDYSLNIKEPIQEEMDMEVEP